MKAVLKAFALLVLVMVILGFVGVFWMTSRGISAKAQPGRLETVVARTLRHLAIPRSARDLKNPVERTPEVIAEGMEHYADHCAGCHANNGSGDTEIGRGLYPKPPDMRLNATQSLSDGELFYIIENGVRFTGMAAWSTGNEQGGHDTWHLVHFIRELPRLTPEQTEQMKKMNPRSPDEVREELEQEKASHADADAAKPRPSPHQHKHQEP
jgi:mono/diheme cytochrome c family protein